MIATLFIRLAAEGNHMVNGRAVKVLSNTSNLNIIKHLGAVVRKIAFVVEKEKFLAISEIIITNSVAVLT